MADTERAILAIDLSARGEGMALVADQAGKVIALQERITGVAGLVGAMSSLLTVPGPPLAQVVVARGPGSYMGVRSALAAAVGVAQARGLCLGLVGSLEVQANRVPLEADSLLVVVPAGRGGLYMQRFLPLANVGPGAWVPDSPAMLTRDAAGSAELLPPCALVFDQSGGHEDLRGLPPGAVRSGAGALALLASWGRFDLSGYDLVSADYGVKVGENT